MTFEDMSQSQLVAALDALDFTTTRTGTALRSTDGQTWYEVPENVLGMMPGSTSRYGLFVGSAVTNRCLHSRDMAQSAWTKTSATAALALGGLVHDANWRGDELVTNGGFDVDSDWAKGTGWTISGGQAVASSATAFSELIQNIATLSGKVYEIDVDYSVSAGGIIVFITTSDLFNVPSSGVPFLLMASAGSPQRIVISASGSGFTGAINSISVREVDVHSLLTATANNGTVTQSITDTSAERIAGVWAKRVTGTGAVWMSQGAVTGSALYEDDFSSDTSGEWDYSTGRVDGVKSVSSGALTYTAGASDTGFPRIVRALSVTQGNFYRISGDIGGTVSTANLQISSTSAGFSSSASHQQTVSPGNSADFVFFATEATIYITLQLNEATPAGLTATLDNVTLTEVAETELDLDSTIQLTRLPAATITNPQIAFRFETSGDAIEVYNVNAQRGAILEDPIITAGAAVTRNAESCVKTLAEAPTSIDVTLSWRTPHAVAVTVPFVVDNNSQTTEGTVYYDTSGILKLLVADGSPPIQDLGGVAVNVDVLIQFIWDETSGRASLNGGSFVSSTRAFPSNLSRVRLGGNFIASAWANSPIYRIEGFPQ